MDETGLIRMAQGGDTGAFRALFEDNRQQVFSLAYHYLKNPEDAEDVLQETFIKAYHSLHRYNPDKGASFRGWLNRICVNASIDALRKSKVRDAYSLDAQEAANVHANPHHSNPEKTAQNKEIREKIDQVLDKLSPKQRMIFVLRHYQEYTTREIADYLNSSEGNIKKQLFRAIEILKKRLKRFILEDGYGM
jgi:RNA polymerase sigma-70 factor (ECF subfamily)